MSLEEMKCPNCGSDHLIQRDVFIECQHCGATYRDSSHFKVTKVNIIRDEAKIEKIKAKDRQDERDKKVTLYLFLGMGGIFLLSMIMALVTGGFAHKIDAPADSSFDFRFMETEQAVNAFKDAGFTDIETLPVYNASAKYLERINCVDHITIGGDENWVSGLLIRSKKSYKPDTPVKIYYQLLAPETKIMAPEWDAGPYRGQRYQSVQKALADAYFNNIMLYPLRDLESADDDNNEKVYAVTIDGGTDWSTGFLGAKNEYDQNAEVIIYYHTVKE